MGKKILVIDNNKRELWPWALTQSELRNGPEQGVAGLYGSDDWLDVSASDHGRGGAGSASGVHR